MPNSATFHFGQFQDAGTRTSLADIAFSEAHQLQHSLDHFSMTRVAQHELSAEIEQTQGCVSPADGSRQSK